MTTRKHRSSWTTAVVQVLMVVLLAFGLGVADAWAKERQVRTPSKSAVKADSSASSRTVTRSSSPPSRTARNTRQIAPAGSRPRYGGGHKGHRSHYYGHSHFNLHLGYRYWGFYPYYWGYWGRHFYPPVYYGYGPSSYRSGYLGALDLNIKPKKAEVYLDGDYIGLVKYFDGYPGYLWLEKGTYEISFYMPGYLTVTRELRVYPGSVVDVRLRLEPGEAVLPEKPEKLRQPRAARPPGRYGDRPSDRDDETRYQRRDRWESEGEVGERDVRGEPGRLRLSITPSDATVYLDGRLLGSGQELGRLRAGLIVEPGEHLLEVVRPGFESKELEIRVEEGEDLELAVQLNREPASA